MWHSPLSDEISIIEEKDEENLDANNLFNKWGSRWNVEIDESLSEFAPFKLVLQKISKDE